jgi:hypothetical protein
VKVQTLDMFVMELLGLEWVEQHIRGIGQALGLQKRKADTATTIASGRKLRTPLAGNPRRSLVPASVRELADTRSED